MATNLSNLVLVEIGNTQIPVSSGSLDQGISMQFDGNSDTVFNSVTYVGQKTPTCTFSSRALDVAFAKCGIDPLTIDSTSNVVNLYFAPKLSTPVGTGSRVWYDAAHTTKITINNGFIYLDSFTAGTDSAAEATYKVIASGETENVGLVITPDTTSPAISGACMDAVFLAGIVRDTSSDYPLTNISYNSGIQVEYNWSGGLATPRGAGINLYEPSFTVDSNDISFLNDLIDSNEIVGCFNDLEIFLRKTDRCQSRVPAATAEHIKISVPESTMWATNVQGGRGQSATYSFELRPNIACGETSAILSIDVSAAID